jgi:predicted dehydrogenase
MDEGSLGAPELFTAEFCSDLRWLDRLWVVNGGGAAFDLGIYPVAMAQQFLGNPTSIKATGQTHASGANEEVQVNLGYSSGARASILISGIASTLHHAACSFDKGVVALDAPFFVPSGISLMGKDIYDEAEHWKDDTEVQRHHGLSYQATWLAHFVSEGLLESPVHTHADVVANIRVLEEVVTQVEG